MYADVARVADLRGLSNSLTLSLSLARSLDLTLDLSLSFSLSPPARALSLC